MITCFLKYEVKSEKLEDFEHYSRRWITLVEKFGGQHHGYFMPSEGASDIAYALFSFESLAAYEEYRAKAADDPEVIEVMDFMKKTNCFERYERNFLRPVLDGE